MACWLYEGMLLFGVLFMASYLFSSLSQTRHGLDNRSLQQGFLFVVLGIYFTWFWAKGQTLAMKTWDVRVVDVHGRPITQWRAMARYVLSWVLVYTLLSRFHAQGQFVHDALAGTRLIPTQAPQRKTAP
jgi:uncharacterized RDD family membrane protein YckC